MLTWQPQKSEMHICKRYTPAAFEGRGVGVPEGRLEEGSRFARIVRKSIQVILLDSQKYLTWFVTYFENAGEKSPSRKRHCPTASP